jgi:hypothetical protein
MGKIILILLFTVFCSSFSFAATSEKITVDDVDDIFMVKIEDEPWKEYTRKKYTAKQIEQLKSSMKRQKNRRIAKCLYGQDVGSYEEHQKCAANIIRNLLKKSEINKKRKPGDLFYVLDAITVLLPGDMPPRVLNHHWLTDQQKDKDKIKPDWSCHLVGGHGSGAMNHISCSSYTKSFKKKLEKFKINPTNEKVLGRPVVKYIKNIKLVERIIEKVGDNNQGYYSSFLQSKIGTTQNMNINLSHYSLIGDMLNESVADIKKNNLSPELKQRRILLKKYSLILQNIENKIEIDKFKSIDKDVSKLSKTYETLKVLEKNPNEIIANIDKAVNIILDTNKLILKSSLNAKDDEEEKLLSLASINFMQSLIDSILSIIPEIYIVETKELKKHLFNEYDLETIEVFINTMAVKNKKSKIEELTKSTDTINKYINTSDVIKKLSNIGMKSIFDKEITINSAVKTAELQIKDSLNQDIFKNASSILQSLDQNNLSEITDELSEVASEVASDSSFQEATSDSVLDKQFGEVSLKQLIGAARNR